MKRLWIVFTVFCLCFLAIIARLFYWQIIRGRDLKKQAVSQYSGTVHLAPSRGEIRTSDGYTLAANEPVSWVYASPKDMDKPLLAAQKIVEVLALDGPTVEQKIADTTKTWVSLSRKVSAAKTEVIKSLGLKGIGFEREYARYYPEGSMAAHLLGFVGYDQNAGDKGYFGLEGYYDRELRGKAGEVTAEWDPKGAPILVGGVSRIDAQNGRTLTLWLDRTIQHFAETHLKEGLNKYGAVSGTVVIMDPQTGGILASAAYPNYDPHTYPEWENTVFPNPIVASSYEPGSTFKAIVMAIGIDEGKVKPDTMMDESGPVKVNEYMINTWDFQYRGKVSMTDVLRYSSNVGMVYVGNQLGKDSLLSRVKSFGFGERTGIDLEDEVAPPLRADGQWADIDYATLTFGQGVAVTPIQMVRATAALANGGWLVEPKVVKSFTDDHGKQTTFEPKRVRRVISEKTSKEITEMLVYTVDNGEAKWAKPKGYRVAGKTGTAQIPVAGRYEKDKTVASFVGYAPADNPKFVMLVTLREPSNSQWGSETAAPLFFAIAKDMFVYMGIPPR